MRAPPRETTILRRAREASLRSRRSRDPMAALAPTIRPGKPESLRSTPRRTVHQISDLERGSLRPTSSAPEKISRDEKAQRDRGELPRPIPSSEFPSANSSGTTRTSISIATNSRRPSNGRTLRAPRKRPRDGRADANDRGRLQAGFQHRSKRTYQHPFRPRAQRDRLEHPRRVRRRRSPAREPGHAIVTARRPSARSRAARAAASSAAAWPRPAAPSRAGAEAPRA